MRRLPEEQHEALICLGYAHSHRPGEFGAPKDQTSEGLKPFDLLVRRGLVIRCEFADRKRGYRIMGAGVAYLLEHAPDDFSLKQTEVEA